MSVSYETLAHSTYQDFAGYRADAPLPASGTRLDAFTLNVGLVLDRREDPAALLAQDWGARQRDLAALEQSGELWNRYGADTAAYDRLKAEVRDLGLRTLDEVAPENGYVSSAAARTLWVQVDESNIGRLFGPSFEIRRGSTGGQTETHYWEGSLGLPRGWAAEIGVRGLFLDDGAFNGLARDVGTEPGVSLRTGAQSIGNHAARGPDTAATPDGIAARHYAFPLDADSALRTGSIAVLEPRVGDAVPEGSFQHLLDTYRRDIGITEPATYRLIAPGGQAYVAVHGKDEAAGERSLDVGVLTAAAPRSELLIYAGSGIRDGAKSQASTAYQAAIWDEAHRPGILSSSVTFNGRHSTPDSPFWFAGDGLFTDAALRGIAVFQSAGDGGSGGEYGSGLPNTRSNQSSPYAVLVGGTSVSTVAAASTESGLAELVQRAMAHDPATLWRLVAGGLTALPRADADGTFIETVWNEYAVSRAGGVTTLDTAFQKNFAGGGGIDPTHPVPGFQAGLGDALVSADPARLTGRALPDLALTAGGNLFYTVPTETMAGTTSSGGTSASVPLMAALGAQIDAIFADQGLPRLGYHTDLYYLAARLVPGAFNDVTEGNNTSSFQYGGTVMSDGVGITPTGYGYAAGWGFDLATGLGSPNGVLLARALTAIGHGQTTYAGHPGVIAADGRAGWVAGAGGTLLLQAMGPADAAAELTAGDATLDIAAMPGGAFAWTGRLATQSLQPDFAPELVRLFDGAAQGALAEQTVMAGEAIALTIGGLAATAPQGTVTAPFGFADFATTSGTLRLAQPVAEAQTIGAADGQVAIARIRQNSVFEDKVLFYRVDDREGHIGALAPGDTGYDAASLGRAYATSAGAWVDGPGHGEYRQVGIAGVNSGDLIAMRLRGPDGDFWAFARANERDADGTPVPHLWHYGLNTWGWEDIRGGGDRDYNDLIVQIDFTSAGGSGVLA